MHNNSQNKNNQYLDIDNLFMDGGTGAMMSNQRATKMIELRSPKP